MTLAEFKRLVRVGDQLRCVMHDYIPNRMGEVFTIEHAGPSVMRLRDEHMRPMRFEWPKATDVVEVSEEGITYMIHNKQGRFLIRHELVPA